uniref:Uncharacterized protein n=1 Tax=Taeniopygia guttata TaxID=59729 RepID=A0A674HS06_TAEGU
MSSSLDLDRAPTLDELLRGCVDAFGGGTPILGDPPGHPQTPNGHPQNPPGTAPKPPGQPQPLPDTPKPPGPP